MKPRLSRRNAVNHLQGSLIISASSFIEEMAFEDAKGWDRLAPSRLARESFNPIRTIVEAMMVEPNPSKGMISLALGDPTTFGNLKAPKVAEDAIVDAIKTMKFNGYAPSSGYVEAREAVAMYLSGPGSPDAGMRRGILVSADDIILCSGCSGALDMCISALADPGDNILVPCPGFPLYKTLANGLGVETREYRLLPEKGWECDLDHLESLIKGDGQVKAPKALVVNNPSNPCGSVYSANHLMDILDLAAKYRVPVVADEIYENFVFRNSGKTYVPMASLRDTVPVLSCGGLTKRFMVPGWRLGWISIHDTDDEVLTKSGVRQGLANLSQRILGPNTLVQAAVPTILNSTPDAFFEQNLAEIEANARMAFELFSKMPGLSPIMPEGAMYMMVGIDQASFPNFEDSLQFTQAMIREQSVFCLPGHCFGVSSFFRVVLTVPAVMLKEALERIAAFVEVNSVRPQSSFSMEASGPAWPLQQQTV